MYNPEARRAAYLKKKLLWEACPEEKEEQRQYNNEARQRWRKNHLSEVQAKARKEYEDHPGKMLYQKAKQRAKYKGLEFNIGLEDIVIPDVCPYLKTPLDKSYKDRKKTRATSPSLDRIDNTKGYMKGNVRVISHQANTMKANASRKELLVFAQSILDNDWFE